MPRKDPLQHKAYDKEYHALNKGRWKKPPEYNRDIMRKWRANNPLRDKENTKKSYLKNIDKIKTKWQTPEGREIQRAQRLKRLEDIAGRPKSATCEICGDGEILIVFDHNHNTGKFRGWICHDCNLCLGHARDNPILLQKLIDYLLLNTDESPMLENPLNIHQVSKLRKLKSL